MANVRAYKIAEELGIERNEFVEKANAIGIVLKNAMASVDPEQAEVLRDKLGAKKSDRITEARVQARGGTAVIRRRKKKAPEPEAPVAEVAPEPVAGRRGRSACCGSRGRARRRTRRICGSR